VGGQDERDAHRCPVEGVRRVGVDVQRPKEFDELTELLRPRGEQIFFGAYDPDAKPIGMGERVVRHMPAARDTTPAGDFRDWAAIDSWAREIAEATSAIDPQPE
jgi:menaquinone-dependent protoporphyrinogen oxidase